MRSPNKDLTVNIENSSPSKEGLWDFTEHDSHANEPSSLSTFSVSENTFHGLGEDPEIPIPVAGSEVSLLNKEENVVNSPSKKQTARKSMWRGTISNLDSSAELNTVIKSEPLLDDDAVNLSAKVLHFFCQKCNNGIRYSPNDLQKHFLISHNGELPMYPCEMCSFSANDFQIFKQHRKTHRSALVKCEICNNDYLYTLLDLTKHFTIMHCVNGHFNCSKCKFSTRDVGTFVQHIHRHNGIEYACQKCNHISYSKVEFQKHLQGHSALFPFSCQYCNYSAMRKDFIAKHILARHREHIHTRDELLQESCDRQMNSAGLKLVLKRYQTDSSNKSLWRNEAHSGEMDNEEDDDQGGGAFQYKSMEKRQSVHELSAVNSAEQTVQDGIASVTTIKYNKDDCNLPSNLNALKNAVHGPTVLMVKNNKINVPANYSATFMGYKMVNGKQNIVIKLLPTTKQSGPTPPSPQLLNKMIPQGHNLKHYEMPLNGVESRPIPSFKSPISSPCPTASMPKFGVPFRARKESSNPIRQGTAASQAFLESIRKDLGCHNIPSSSFGSGLVSKIKEEPEEFNITEQQNNIHLERNRSYEFSPGQIPQSRAPNFYNLNPNLQHLLRQRHSSDSGLALSKNLYSKDDRSTVLHTIAASRTIGSNFPNSNKSKNECSLSNAPMNDKQSVFLEKSGKCDNVSFMPRITSVFSLQNRTPAPAPVAKNTYLHNMLQENKTLYDKMYATKTQSHLTGCSTPTSSKQMPTNSALKFDTRSSDSVFPGSVPNTVSPFMQGQVPSITSLRLSHSRVGDLLKAHSDAIVNQQLAKEKMIGVARTTGSSQAFRVLKNPPNSSFHHPNTVLLPSSSSNALLLPLVPTNQASFKMPSTQPTTQSNIGVNTSTPQNAGNTKSNMVLTFANGSLGTIRNVTNGGPHTMASQTTGTINSQGKIPLPRLPRPAGPYLLNADFKDIRSTVNNVPANIISGSTPTNNHPINLNLLQYCINSDSSVAKTGNLSSVNKKQEMLQKQPVYALLPDGKQAVLLNYVLPKTPPNSSQQTKRNFPPRNIQPKRTDGQEASFFISNNKGNSPVKIKIEDTSADEFTTSEKIHANSIPRAEHMHCSLRPRPNFSSTKDHLYFTSNDKMLPPCSANVNMQNKSKYKPSLVNTWNTKSKTFKRKASVDSTSYRADCEMKNKVAKKKLGDDFQEPPRKRMLHRKCKEKTYTSEVVAEFPTPRPSKDAVQTLRLYPLSSSQLVKYPQQNHPVVVLNHPDADVPEVISVMKTISKFSGQILKVTLSKSIIEALLESKLNSSEYFSDGLPGRRHRRAKPVSPIKERFVLKLTLKKTSKNNYKIVKNTSENQHKAKFHCWFCGRIFDNQDEWVGHGQRHLMEATKDWNTLF